MKKVLLAACLLATLPFPCRCGPMFSGGTTPGAGRIAFVSDRDGNEEIYAMNADPSAGSGPGGSGLTNLTNNPTADGNPAWSPDGRRVAFDSFRDPGRYDIYVMNADPSAGSGPGGSEVKNLTNDPPADLAPAWSPDGQRIAFTSHRDDNAEIYVMKADGSGLTNLTNHAATDQFPVWSPDGEHIAFTSDRAGNAEIYVMNADPSAGSGQGGSGVTRLTNNPANDTFPAWSPDGSHIAFQSGRDGPDEIYVMSTDGSGVTRLTDNRAYDGAPAWSPDGKRIAFVSMRDGNDEIYVMNADGSEQTNLTNHPSADRWPSWGP